MNEGTNSFSMWTDSVLYHLACGAEGRDQFLDLVFLQTLRGNHSCFNIFINNCESWVALCCGQ